MVIRRLLTTAMALFLVVSASVAFASPPKDGQFGKKVAVKRAKVESTRGVNIGLKRPHSGSDLGRIAFNSVGKIPSPGFIAKKMGAKSSSKKSTLIYGSMQSNPTWSEYAEEYGMYSFATDEYSPVRVFSSDEALAGGGGVLVGDYYYSVNVEDFYGYMFYYCYKYNVETWEQEDYNYVSAQDAALDMTYDPMTGKVYGCFKNNANDGYVWATLNLSTGKRSDAICDFSVPMLCVAANQDGDCYTIDA